MSSGIDMSFVIGNVKPDPVQRDDDQHDCFRILVLGDFSARASRRDQREAASFRPITVDLDNLDAVFARLAVRLQLVLPSAPEPVTLSLTSLDDFEPDRLFADQPLFARLRDLRRRLADASTFEQAAAELRAVDSRTAASSPGGSEDDAATLARLLGQAPSAAAAATPANAVGVDAAVDRLIRHAVEPHRVADRSHLQRPLIEALDCTIAATMRELLRDPHWRALEGAWRAVDKFVRSVEMDGRVVLELVDADAADLLDSLAAAQGDAAKMALARGLAAQRARDASQQPYALVVATFEFGSSSTELALLAGLGAVAAAENAVLLSAAAASLALIDAPTEWDDVVAMPADALARARWQAMRASWLAPHIGLVWPRVMARLPYGERTQPISAFAFEELGDASDHALLPWRTAALDLAALLASAFVEAGWDMQASSAVEIDDLPAFTDRSGEAPRLQAVAEMYMSERQSRAIAAAGVMPLISHRSLPHARLGGWRSIAAESAELAARWQS